MYRIVRENIENYQKLFRKDEERYKLVKPFKLLESIELYNESKEKSGDDYLKLCSVINNVKAFSKTDKFRKCSLAIKELENLGFNFHVQDDIKISKNELICMMDIFRQFMFFTYLD
jgi:hypothetical protein